MRGIRIGGVPLHPLLVHFPVAAWTVLPFLDAVRYLGMSADPAFARAIALFGVVAGLLAMIAGSIDLIALRHPDHQRLALRHMMFVGSAWALALFAAILRNPAWPARWPVVTTLDVLVLILLAIGGHLGARLVHVHGASIER